MRQALSYHGRSLYPKIDPRCRVCPQGTDAEVWASSASVPSTDTLHLRVIPPVTEGFPFLFTGCHP